MGIKKFFKKLTENTLYYPGCLTKGVLTKEFENYKWIFNKLGVDFILLNGNEKESREVCCGLPVLNAGYKKDARKLAEKNLKLFKERNVGLIVTNCPSCYYTFKVIYPSLVRDWDIEVKHATDFILERLRKKNIDFSNLDKKEIVVYHDPCHLGRHLENPIYDAPREVIQRLGGMVFEFKNSKEESLCCGGGGGLRANYPSDAKKIAINRINNLPNKSEVEKVISPCGLCFKNLESATEKSEEFSSFVKRKLEEFG